MLGTLFWVAVGMFIGWNFPQPSYAKAVQAWVVAKWNALTNRTDV